jgi:hypothetical protein
MAYTATPETQTYTTQEIPAVYDLDIPAGATSGLTSSGAGMINVLPVKHGNEVWGETRYCIAAPNMVPSTAAPIGGVPRGMYVWEKTIGTTYYFVVAHDDATSSSKVYTSTDASTWSVVNTLGTDATTPVRFTEFIDGTNVKKLVMVDGLEGYVFTTNAAGTKIVDADFPTPHVPFPVFIDGYLFLAKAATGDIYNSDLNDPAVWTAGSFISSELYPDDIQALVKVNNYLLAIGTQGCEYFYDAANPTASPLARIDSLSLPFGTPFPNSLACTKDTVVFLANNNDGSVTLKAIEGTKSVDIPCPFISYLNYLLSNSYTTAAKLRGMFFRHGNSLCYALKFDGANKDVISNVPYLVYSFDAQMWTEYQWSTSTTFTVCFTAGTISNQLLTYVAGYSGEASATGIFFGTFVPQQSSGIAQDTVGGVSVNIPQEIRTTPQDFDSINTKTLLRFGIVYTTLPALTLALGIPLVLKYTDSNAYGSFSTSYTIASTNGYGFPFFQQLGSFRQRVFKITYSGASGYSVRFKRFEVKINRHMN